MIEDGKFIPKWKHERELEKQHIDPEIKVIVNGHRYNII